MWGGAGPVWWWRRVAGTQDGGEERYRLRPSQSRSAAPVQTRHVTMFRLEIAHSSHIAPISAPTLHFVNVHFKHCSPKYILQAWDFFKDWTWDARILYPKHHSTSLTCLDQTMWVTFHQQTWFYLPSFMRQLILPPRSAQLGAHRTFVISHIYYLGLALHSCRRILPHLD